MKFSNVAPELLELGWSPIPVIPKTKRPAIKTWSEYCNRLPFEHETVFWSIKYPDYSVGFACGKASNIWALDIDADDRDQATRMEAITDEIIGPTPLVRIGRSPRSLRVYQSLEPVKSVKGESLDVLGGGRQFVAFGLHAVTSRPYEWIDESPLNYEAAALPTVNPKDLAGLLSALKKEFGPMVPPEAKPSQWRSKPSLDTNDLSAPRRGLKGEQRYEVLREQLRMSKPGCFHDTMVSVIWDLVYMKMSTVNIHRFFDHHFSAPRTGEYAEVWSQINTAIYGAKQKCNASRH
tara:strand:+ start:1850 stop:2725 length:876 start_codon:yes stop_codon:yes gene_type:complete